MSGICSTTPSKTLHLSTNPRKRLPKTTQDHQRPPKTTEITDITENTSETLHLSTNPRKRSSWVILGSSKTLHLSTNPRKGLSKTLHLSTNPPSEALDARIGCSGVTGHSKTQCFAALCSTTPRKTRCSGALCLNRLLRSHWALENIVFCCTLLDKT